jgi:predicted ATPase
VALGPELWSDAVVTTSPAAIRTPDQRLRIFVSSTLQELADEREAVKEAIEQICLTPVMFEIGARAHPPRDLYRAYLAQSDVFIGIYWQRYGWVAPTETISGLEDEYLLARSLPKLVYIKRADSREERLKGLIGRIQGEDKVSYRPFRDAEELKQLVRNDLALMLTERFSSSVTASNVAADESSAVEAAPRYLPPVERGELIGRQGLEASIGELIAKSDTGCLTLTGPGGTGKTRLAIRAANALADRFADGVFYVPLASVRSGRDVLPAIVSVLDLPTPPSGAEPEKRLVAFLRARRALLVLDNFEQVLDAAGDIGRVLAACPHLKLIITSREPLRINGERELPIPPLAHQGDGRTVTPAMQLFEQRAREIRPDFSIDDGNRSAVAEICRRLDALPLAIELAAARVRVLSPQAMLPRLDKCLALLTGGRRDLPERQQTLRGALDWSHELLSPDERVFFRRLGIFAGSFPEEGAAAVVGDAALEPLEGLTSLVEKSLLVRNEAGGQVRFQMLETVREFARERVAQAGEERDARVRHAAWVSQILADARSTISHATKRVRTHEQLAAEEGNVRAAFSFLTGADGDREQAWELLCHLGWVRHHEFRGSEIRVAYDALRPGGEAKDPVTAAAALGLAAWATFGTPSAATVQDLERSLAVLDAHGDRRFLPGVLTAYASILGSLDPARALPFLDRAVALSVELGLHTIESWARMMRCLYFMMSGQPELADQNADALITASARHGEQEGITFGMTMKGRLQLLRGDLTAARESFANATAYARTRSSAYGRADALSGLASVALAQGDEVAARAVLEELVHFSGTRNGTTGLELVWGALAHLLAKAGDDDRARRVLEVIARGVENVSPGLRMQLDPAGTLAKATAEARALLGDPEPLAPEQVDLEVALRAALGARVDG